MGWQFRIDQTFYSNNMQVVGWARQPDGRTLVLQPFAIKAFAEGDLAEDVFIDMEWEKARSLLQGLVDACFDHGIRPSGIEDFRRANDAQKAHLEDFRAIVSKTVGVILPGADG